MTIDCCKYICSALLVRLGIQPLLAASYSVLPDITQTRSVVVSPYLLYSYCVVPPYMATSWYAVWIPVVAFAHLFSLFWILKTWALSKAHGLLRKKRKLTTSTAVATTAQDDSPSPLPQHVATASKDVTPQKRQTLMQRTRTFLGLGRTVTIMQQQDSFHSASSGSDELDDEDAVPDVSLEACTSLRRTMSLVPDSMTMEWRSMGCAYHFGGISKVVLQGISGGAAPGEMQVSANPAAVHNQQHSITDNNVKQRCVRCLLMVRAVGFSSNPAGCPIQ